MNHGKIQSYGSRLKRAYNEFKLFPASGVEKELAAILEMQGKERQIKLIEFLLGGGLEGKLSPSPVKRAVGY